MKKIYLSLITLLLCNVVSFAVDVKPGSEYVTEKIIRDTKAQTSDPKPFSLNIETLDNGNVRFTMGTIDGTTITWQDQGIILDNLQLWTNGDSQAAKNYFTKVEKPDKEAYFDLVPKTTIPSDAVIVFNQSIMYWYGNEARATNIQGKQDYIIYTYGTNTSDASVSSLCNMRVHQGDANEAYITATTSEGGVITFTISNEAGTAYFRADDGGGMNAEAMILRSYTNPAWCGKSMNDYFERTTITNNVDNIPQNQKIVFTPKSGVTVPEDLVISYYDSQIAWRIGTTAAWNKFPWRYHYGTGCTAGKTIKAAATDVAKYSAKITLDKSKFYDDAAYKIKIKEAGGEYSYVSGGPFSEIAFPYTLNNLSQGTTYNVVVEGAYPDFDDPEDEKSSNTVTFTTIVSGSEVCDRPFVNGANSIGVSLETLPNGNLAWTITSSTPAGATWKDETYAKEANSIYVNGAAGSTYFNDPVITADGKSAVLTLKQAVPANAVITLQAKKIVWYNANKEVIWIDGGTQFDNFTYTYGKYCCAQGSIRLQATDIKRSSANIYAAKSCLDDDAIAYVYRFKYKKSSESDYTVIDGYQSQYALANLSVGARYDAVLEAAYPSFDAPELSWSGNTSFSTMSSASDVCDLAFTSGGSTALFSFVTVENGDMELVIGGAETNYAYRECPSIDKFQVNGGVATTYFDATHLSTDKTKIILPLKSGSTIKADDVVKFNNGTLAWKSDSEGNAWVENKSFSTRYQTSCCTEGSQLEATVTSTQTTSASIQISDLCLNGQNYKYRLRYKLASSSTYQTLYEEGYARPEGGVFNLSSLLSGMDYEAIAEAAYPDFDNPTKLVEQSEVEFSTVSKGGEACGKEFTSSASTIAVSMESLIGGDVVITMSTDEADAHFRVEGLSSNIANYKVNGADASTYFNNPSLNDAKTVITLQKKADLPADAVITFDGVIAWSTALNTNAYVMGAKLTHTYGTTCCFAGSKLLITEITPSTNSATVSVNDDCISGESYVKRLKYRIAGSAGDYSVASAPVDNVYTLTGLHNDYEYEVIYEAAYPSFEQHDVYESASSSFTTLVRGSEICDFQFTSTNSIGVSIQTEVNGDVTGTIVSQTYTGGTSKFANEGGYIASDISFYNVKYGDTTEAASEYFETPQLSDDLLSFTMKLKSGVTLPANSKLVLAKTGKIVWMEDATARWCDSDAAFVGFEHTYGTICCVADNAIRFGATEVSKNSAQLKLMDDCIFGEGYTYSLEYGVKGSGTTTEIAGRPEGGLYNLSDLYYETTYTATVTATNSALGRVESKSIEFTTKSASSEACSVEFTGVNAEHTVCYISMETSPSGDIVVSISGENNTKFRTEGLTYDIKCYKVNGADADAYFDAPVLSSDKLTATLKSKGNVPDGATISFAGTISWTSDLGDDYITGQSMTHTYGTWCCEVSGFKMTRCEGLSNTTAIVEIDNLCIEDKPYVYRYSLKEGEGEYGAPVSFTGLTINLDGLSSATTYNIKIEAALPDFDDPEDVREQIGTFSTSALSPAPVPTYSENLVKTVYSSTYGEAANLNWNYYTFVKTLSNEVISSESVLKKCVMYATPTAGKEPQNGVLIKYPSFWDVSAMVNLHFDLWISAADAVKSPYVGVKLRHEDGANTSWYICNDQLTGNAWNSFDIPVSWFAENESLDLSEVLSMMIIPIANKTGSTADAQFSAEEYTIYLDNIFYYIPGAAKIGDNYYNTLAEAVAAAQDYDEITLVADIDEDLNVAGKSISFDADGHSIASVTVAANASLTLASDLALTGDFILKSDITTSGQFSADGNAITIGGNAYFDKKFSNSSAIAWYTFALPFSVSVNDIYDAATGTNLEYYNETYAQYFNGASRANGGAVWTGIDEGSLSAGTLYTFTVRQAAKYKDIRFKASDKSSIVSPESIPLTYHTGTGDQSLWGWNGVGNNQLFGASMSVEGLNFGQAYNASTKGYDLIMLNDHTFNAGDAIFFQCAQNGNVIVAKASTKSAEASYNPYILEISAAGVDATDKCFVTVSDDASPAYQIGKDLVKMGDYKNYGHATLWVEAYGKQLAVVDAQSQSGATDIALGINAPKAGSYTLSLSAGDADNDIYLTLGGEVIWDFADGAYALNLKQGAASGYGLRIEGDVPTSVAEEEAGSNKAIKYIENGAVVIEVNGVRYNLQGIIIK